MQCPKCESPMDTKSYGNLITLERCTNCFGMLVAPEVLTQMKQEWMADALLDIGHPKVGKAYDAIDEIDCPVCNVRMDKIMDPVQTHIWMESCPNCEKIFLDAGEFTDLKYETLMDKFRDLVTGKRP